MQKQDSPNTEKPVRDGSCRGALPGAERVQVTCERFEFCGLLTP